MWLGEKVIVGMTTGLQKNSLFGDVPADMVDKVNEIIPMSLLVCNAL